MYIKNLHIAFLSFFLTISFFVGTAQNKTKEDSTHVEINEILTNKDTAKKKKSFLEDILRRNAKQYEKIDQKKKQLTLYDEAELYYKDIELKSGIIVLDYQKNLLRAGRLKDSVGNYSQYPYFKQGSNVVEPDSIIFNTKTKRLKVWNSKTKQGELNIIAEQSKRENDSTYFMKNARMTTAVDVDDPEYYFLVRRVKFVPKKKVVAGLTNMVIQGVPTPIGLPFAYFPMSEESISGFIIPTPGQSNNRGYFLQNGGYYFALNDYVDLALLGDYYTNGSYGLRAESSYALRYKFNGRVNLRYENLVESERGFPDYSLSKNYNIQWSHNQDAKASANSRFSASVNLGSQRYFQNSLNVTNINARLVNNLSSSISYSKTFQTIPQVNMSLTATHSQNSSSGTINMTLPTLQASVDRVFPFASEDETKKGFIKNINLQYNLRGENQITTHDSIFMRSEMFKDSRLGFQHTIPVSTNFKIFRYFSVSASTNFNEVWTFNTIRKSFDFNTNKEVITEINNFDSYRTYNFNSSIGTTVYGTFNISEKGKIQAIRHIIRPNISYSYVPSFDQYWDTYAIDANGTTMREYSRFEQGLFGTPSKNFSNNIGISINNTLEAKVRNDDKGSKEEYKKVMLLNNLTFNTSYNMAADSLQWNPISVAGGTQLFKNKLNINFASSLDLYALDNAGKRINRFNMDNGGGLFRMTSANIAVNYRLSSDELGRESNPNSQNQMNGGREDDLFGTGVDMSDGRQSMFANKKDNETKEEESDIFNSKVPWDINIAYTITYNNASRQNEISNNSLMFSGNVELTPKWIVGISSGYDFKQKGITFTQLRFERDLDSWRMNFNWVPFGPNTFWGFFIGIKSSMLSDIKWEQRRLPDNRN